MMTTVVHHKIPLGIRLCNPLNIKHSPVNWIGKAAIQSHPTFVQFVDAHHGIRAAARNLLTYYRRDKINTLEEIISKWAPPEDDNDTGGYISRAAERMGVAADAPLDLEDPEVLAAVIVSMIPEEVGSCPYSGKTIAMAVAAAYGSGTAAQPPQYTPSSVNPASGVTTGKADAPLVDQPTTRATRKVKAAPIGAMGGLPVAFFAKVLWDKYFPEQPMPTEIAMAIAAAASSALAYLAAYYTRNRAVTPVISPIQE